MVRYKLLQKAKIDKEDSKFLDRKEWVGFVRNQFKELMKKNIRVPIQLYHL